MGRAFCFGLGTAVRRDATADSSLRRRVRSGFGRNDKGVLMKFQFQRNLVKRQKLRESEGNNPNIKLGIVAGGPHPI